MLVIFFEIAKLSFPNDKSATGILCLPNFLYSALLAFKVSSAGSFNVGLSTLKLWMSIEVIEVSASAVASYALSWNLSTETSYGFILNVDTAISPLA